MYTVTIRDHMMIAHSLPSKAFGPAQNLHGATYVVDAEFKSAKLDENNIVIDIDIATKKLQKALEPLKYQNLDELPQFQGKLTTTEFLAKYVHEVISSEIRDSFKGSLKITLGESHVAWAAYEGEVV
ncbi:6-pyruvoyltetrahydropterin/6-carboxytetrahydropterin synthase [Catalinimonas alkaloidigena]|uniref:6-pyruvoyl trahydropterin synthase family protein n=1 Tax=Catalinimonas alkaloidigena TaxID=1075417 RepID=UPI002406C54C|nr:6-carboxytetrahydropterin synthase [Catalinimonas alkaloidigena]MDF9795647.1 6-pyruvoyltetrahydropterin/6-carboxytetrahydropterin synthase [Catalinimonas alkaloidigena]